MPTSEFDARLVSEVYLDESRGWWYVHARYGERLYNLGEWRL